MGRGAGGVVSGLMGVWVSVIGEDLSCPCFHCLFRVLVF